MAHDRTFWISAFAAVTLAAACGDSGLDPDRDAGPQIDAGVAGMPYLWAEIDLSGADDLGHDAQPIPPGEQTPAGAITLVEDGMAAGLANAVGRGNAHGVGIGFVDLTGDGYADILIANGAGTNSMFWTNNGDGTFGDATAASGVEAILGGLDTYSVATADYDRDGDLDVYITAHPEDVLMQNDGNGVFTDVTAAAGVGGPPSSQPGSASKIAAWGDYDGDGLLDVVVGSSTFTGGYPNNAYLMRNNGDGSFTDVTAAMSLFAAPTGNPCAVMWSDYDSDGDQDLWIWNDRGNSSENRALLRNDGDRFTDVTVQVGADFESGNPMGIDGADFDHDGYLDYYVADIGGNELLHNQRDGTFREIAREAGAAGEYGWGLGFEDFNADTWADIFVAQEDDRDYLTFTNQGTTPPSFVEQAWPHVPVGNGHNVAVGFADYDHNGTIDIVTAPTSGSRITLYRNDTDRGTNRWLEVRVPVTPGTGSYGGVTGRVVVKTGELYQFRDITAGSSRASQNAMSVRFGLGQWTGAEWVAVLWPDGRQVAVTGVEGNRVLDMPSQ